MGLRSQRHREHHPYRAAGDAIDWEVVGHDLAIGLTALKGGALFQATALDSQPS